MKQYDAIIIGFGKGTGGRFARYHHDARYTFVPRHHAGGLGTQPGERRIRFPVTVRCRTAGD